MTGLVVDGWMYLVHMPQPNSDIYISSLSPSRNVYVIVVVRSRLCDRDCFQWVRSLRLRLPLGGVVVEPGGLFSRHRPLEQHTEPAEQVPVAKSE